MRGYFGGRTIRLLILTQLSPDVEVQVTKRHPADQSSSAMRRRKSIGIMVSRQAQILYILSISTPGSTLPSGCPLPATLPSEPAFDAFER
jgi:hypothetical protein